MKKLAILIPMIFIGVACTQSAPATDPSVINARAAEWEAALNAKDIDAVAAFYESDARVLPPNEEMQTGHDAVRAAFGAMIDAGLTVKLNDVETMVSGDLAYNVGKYTLAAEGTQVDAGKYMEIWHRGDDGQWRYTNDMWSSDLAATVAAAEPSMPVDRSSTAPRD